MKRTVLFVAGLILAAAAWADDPTQNIRIGGEVRITEALDGPLHAAGGDVTLDAPVNGAVHMAGGSVKVGPAAVVSEGVSVAGGTVDIEGSIKGKLRAAGGEVRINGPVGGDASVAAGTLELGPDARIEGKLYFRGDELRQDPAAKVTGPVEHVTSRHASHRERTMAERFMHGWLWSVGLIALAALIAAALPGASQRMAQELRERPWITPLVGLVALTAIPIAAVLVMITIIGIPLGLLALFAYAALLLLGYAWIAVVTGGMLLDRVKPEIAARSASKVGAAMLAMLALAILVRMPFIGGAVKLVALAVGVGMIVAVIFRHTRPAPA